MASSIPIHILSYKAYIELESYENLFYGILIGVVLLVILMSIFLFFQSREKIYLYYSFYVFFLAATVLSIGGYIIYLFDQSLGIFSLPGAYYIFILCSIAFSILFTHSFFEIHTKGPKWLIGSGRVVVFICFLSALLFLIDLSLVYKIRLLYIYIAFGVIVVTSVAISLYRGEILAKFYLIAFLPLVFSATFLTFSEIGLIKSINFLNFLGPSFLWEISVLLVGLAYRLYDYQRKKQALEKEMIVQQIQTQESERQRLAQDLHDDLGGTLSAIKGRITNEETNLETIHLVEKAIEDLRLVSRNLLPPELANDGLAQAIHHTIERLQRATSIKFTYITFGKNERMKEERELHIYRVISEILNNIIKHSRATEAVVQIVFYGENLHVAIEDNGIGIKTDPNTWGIGIKNIHSRVEFLKAKILIDSSEKGTTIILDVPYY